MKKLITIITMTLLATVASAEIPEYLRDGVITVTLTDGSVYTFSSNEYKVVKRGVKADSPRVQPTPSNQPRGNSLILHAGMSKDGLKTTHDGNRFSVKERYRPTFGVTFCKGVDEQTGLCFTGMTNNTFMLGVELDL